MIMKKANYLLVIALTTIIGIGLTSCSKEEVEGNVTKTKMIVKNWKYKSLAGQPILLPCLKDDVLDFKLDGTYTINVGSDICFGETNQHGTWELSTDGKLLTLKDKDTEVVTRYDVVSISLKELVVKMKVGNLGIVTVTLE